MNVAVTCLPQLHTVYALVCICHPEEGFRYVGQSNNAMRRLREHLKTANPDGPQIVQKWIARHGTSNIRMVFLAENLASDEVDEMEARYVRQYHGAPSWLVNMKTPKRLFYSKPEVPTWQTMTPHMPH